MKMSEKLISAKEVEKHTTSDSCWVVLYGNVYDVTKFLPEHPGGSKIILQLAGRDATEEYDPIHPPGTLEENLKPEAKLGRIDPQTIAKTSGPETKEEKEEEGPPPMESLLNLNEIEEVATKRMPEKAWAYYYSASDDQITKSFNNAVYKEILLRPRVFVDCTNCDTSTSLLGHRVGLPIFVAPAAMARLGHPDGEAGIARACARFGALQVISNNASMTPEQVVADAAPGQVFGWQLYVQNDRARSEAMLARVNRMRDRFKFVVLTLDAPAPGKRELDEKQNFKNATKVASGVKTDDEPSRPGGGGVGQQLFFGTASDLTWKVTLPWLAKHTDLPIVLKGVHTHEDAFLAARHAPQVKAVILSNHGGRALDTASPPVYTLLEIRKYCPEVFDKIEVWVDGGIKRGTDVVKALALGARAVGVGRAALFGLGAGGQAGVERTLEILKAETETCMRLLGVQNVSELGPRHINTSKVERDIFNGGAGLETFGLWDKVKSKL
ncbi:FMN-dependent dehydrogenase-domain-containing protein [Annulohypoxylon truncatum]|uniref:FMN-dependent dehydrogenase-domain-containing protein n=1 Tax=Annulohypoxylon truncatum TaxID=327061 RepID=UPI002008A98C|nr:FMN-dependent dehydrogenase-domain-containing protein [Annulohypoxylon truncatum]KAI1213986.1 FMN-dependent dehydrogenase-domain-containing protein [Annulohypoxylon truncatum]